MIQAFSSRCVSGFLVELKIFLVFQLSSADLKKPLEKETAKLREMKEKLEGKAPGKQKFQIIAKKFSCNFIFLHDMPCDETKANASLLNESWVPLALTGR